MDIIHKKNPITDFITHKKDFHTISPLEDKKFSKSFYKSFILDILSLFFAFVFGFYFFNYLNNKTNFLIFLISGILFLTIIIFETLLNLNWSRRFLIIFLETILLFYF
ncbi:MAG: hypothetical protein NZ484_02260, partial [Patescibacteria group bacterium]|nr:hypothetical protein [Patescibacteria group bacterium]MDW8280056.1 hypothetical protein [bacterium]